MADYRVDETSELILVGDRVLVSPAEPEGQTRAGLYLPDSVRDKEKIQSGRIVAVGPGYFMPNPNYEDEPWKGSTAPVRYLPLQAREGDIAYFLRKEAIELIYNDAPYVIIPHHAILALLRNQPDERDIYRG